MALLRWVCYIFVANTLAEHPQRDYLLWRTIGALDLALDYLAGQIKNINLDGVIGTRMAEDQISVLLNRTILFENKRYQKLFRPIFLLQRKAESIADRAISMVKHSDPEYFKNIGKILSNGLWLLDYPEREIRRDDRKDEIPSEERLNEKNSDKCISQVVGIEDEAFCPCKISEECWVLMTAPRYSGYSLTHEVIFLQLTEMCMCQQKVEPLLAKYNQSNLANMYQSFCSNILDEAEMIIENYKKTKQDLFMEQIAVCGMVGFVDFFHPEWLKAILGWQLPNGCYAQRTDPAWPSDVIGYTSRKKREEKILKEPLQESCCSICFEGTLKRFRRERETIKSLYAICQTKNLMENKNNLEKNSEWELENAKLMDFTLPYYPAHQVGTDK